MSFQLFGASHIGARHYSRSQNNQDNFLVGELEGQNIRYGIVLDGCGSSEKSEVGAIYAYFLAQKIESLADEKLARSQVPEYLFNQSIHFLNEQVRMASLDIESDKEKVAWFIREYWLFTVLAFIQFPDETIIIHRGDGVIRVNRFLYSIDEENHPQYLGYFVIPWDVPKSVIADPGFNSLTIETGKIDTLILGSDGWNSHLNELRNLESKVDDSESLQMYLNALSFNDNAFDDDTTAVGLIRKV